MKNDKSRPCNNYECWTKLTFTFFGRRHLDSSIPPSDTHTSQYLKHYHDNSRQLTINFYPQNILFIVFVHVFWRLNEGSVNQLQSKPGSTKNKSRSCKDSNCWTKLDVKLGIEGNKTFFLFIKTQIGKHLCKRKNIEN